MDIFFKVATAINNHDDHDKEETETDTDPENITETEDEDENFGDKFDDEENKNVARDHLYFNPKERKSPRFRYTNLSQVGLHFIKIFNPPS